MELTRGKVFELSQILYTFDRFNNLCTPQAPDPAVLAEVNLWRKRKKRYRHE
jgi:hypothetical protein